MIQNSNDTSIKCHRKTKVYHGHIDEIQYVIDLVDLGKDFNKSDEHNKERKYFSYEKSLHHRKNNGK